ncbi:unnamed protein product, partial [Effrenium voratum]
VVRPEKGHLWSTGLDGGDEHGQEDAWLQTVDLWPRGRMPTPEMLAELLRAEQAQDVSIIDLEECGRRDVGLFALVATGVTSRHCRRLGQIMFRATEACKVPFVEPFCYGTREDEWVVAHCGPIKVHLFTRETRDQYQLELLYRSPEDFFQVGDFPHYVEIYGSAVEAMLNGGSHITTSLGSRSQTQRRGCRERRAEVSEVSEVSEVAGGMLPGTYLPVFPTLGKPWILQPPAMAIEDYLCPM